MVVCSNNRAGPDDLLAAIEGALPLAVRTRTPADAEEKYVYCYPPFEYAIGRKMLCFARGAEPGELIVAFCLEIAWQRVACCGEPSKRFNGFMWLDEGLGGWTCNDSYFFNACVATEAQSSRECYRALRGATIASIDLGFRTRDEYAKINSVQIRAQ